MRVSRSSTRRAFSFDRPATALPCTCAFYSLASTCMVAYVNRACVRLVSRIWRMLYRHGGSQSGRPHGLYVVGNEM